MSLSVSRKLVLVSGAQGWMEDKDVEIGAVLWVNFYEMK